MLNRNKKNNIALIIARSGSKRIKDKNILNFFGKPIFYYPFKAAKNSNLGYNGDVDQVLNNNLNTDELNTIMKLENEMNKGEGSISGDVVEGVEKGIKESESLTGKSTVLRVLEDIGNTGIAAVDSITGNDKKE